MSKYIIKNCECFVKNGTTCYNKLYKHCKDVPDCLLKQIVEKCKEHIDFNEKYGLKASNNYFANGILQLIGIEEVE